MTTTTHTSWTADDDGAASPLDAIADAIARGQGPDRTVLARAIRSTMATLAAADRPTWTVTADEPEVVLHRALTHVLRIAADATPVDAPRWVGTAA